MAAALMSRCVAAASQTHARRFAAAQREAREADLHQQRFGAERAGGDHLAPARRPRTRARAGGARWRRWAQRPRRPSTMAGGTARQFGQTHGAAAIQMGIVLILASAGTSLAPRARSRACRLSFSFAAAEGLSDSRMIAEPLHHLRDGAVARLRLNRPQVHNAFDAGLIAELTGALAAVAADATCAWWCWKAKARRSPPAPTSTGCAAWPPPAKPRTARTPSPSPA